MISFINAGPAETNPTRDPLGEWKYIVKLGFMPYPGYFVFDRCKPPSEFLRLASEHVARSNPDLEIQSWVNLVEEKPPAGPLVNRWRCKACGVDSVAEMCPAACGQCKRAKPDLWLSEFTLQPPDTETK